MNETADLPAPAHASSGRICFWQGGSLWIGQGHGRTQWHEHHAHQLALALDGTFRFRTRMRGAWESYEGALVPSHCTHQFELDERAIAHLFIEPESRAGRALSHRFGAGDVSRLPAESSRAASQAVFGALRTAPSREALAEAARLAVAQLSGTTTEPDQALDPRLRRALEIIRSRIREPIALPEIAAAVALSESRFRHLFVAGTGSSFRAYLLWLRINLAIDAAMRGATWTAAAHEAGFADSAHLSRTHRRMFGIEPRALRALT